MVVGQGCMEYANYGKHQNEPVDGFILQAPVSDREGLAPVCPDMDDAIEYATKMIAEGKSDQLVPKDNVPSMVGAPITAYRLHSLLAKGYVQHSVAHLQFFFFQLTR